MLASGVVPAATGSSQTPSSYKEAPFENVNHSGVASKVDLSISNYLKSFSFNDLKTATKNFREENLLGEGGFGCVFKGWIDEITYAPTRPGTGIVVAVKRLKAQSFQGHKEWLVRAIYRTLFFISVNFTFLMLIQTYSCFGIMSD